MPEVKLGWLTDNVGGGGEGAAVAQVRLRPEQEPFPSFSPSLSSSSSSRGPGQPGVRPVRAAGAQEDEEEEEASGEVRAAGRAVGAAEVGGAEGVGAPGGAGVRLLPPGRRPLPDAGAGGAEALPLPFFLLSPGAPSPAPPAGDSGGPGHQAVRRVHLGEDQPAVPPRPAPPGHRHLVPAGPEGDVVLHRPGGPGDRRRHGSVQEAGESFHPLNPTPIKDLRPFPPLFLDLF